MITQNGHSICQYLCPLWVHITEYLLQQKLSIIRGQNDLFCECQLASFAATSVFNRWPHEQSVHGGRDKRPHTSSTMSTSCHQGSPGACCHWIPNLPYQRPTLSSHKVTFPMELSQSPGGRLIMSNHFHHKGVRDLSSLEEIHVTIIFLPCQYHHLWRWRMSYSLSCYSAHIPSKKLILEQKSVLMPIEWISLFNLIPWSNWPNTKMNSLPKPQFQS